MYVCTVCMYVCMYACMYQELLKTTTNSSCVCAHLANKADSDSDYCAYFTVFTVKMTHFTLKWLIITCHIV